jgi:hypothetical protein
MRGRRTVASLVLALLLLGPWLACSGLRRDGARPPARDVAAAVAVDAYRSAGDFLEALFIRTPKLVFVEIPSWLFYHGPRSLWLSASSTRTRVEAYLSVLAGDATAEEQVAAVTALRELTGLPIEDEAEWRRWWETAKDRPEEAWTGDFADRCIEDLQGDDYLLRQEADDRLRALSGIDVGYDAKASEAERDEALGRWREWRAGRSERDER